MGASEQLQAAALNRQPVFYNDAGMAWEQRLALAYDEATKHLQAALPPGTSIDTAQYELANDAVGNQMTAYDNVWASSLEAKKDVPAAAGLTLPADDMRQYYLGKYAQASSNLGGYVTGYARSQIPIGALTQEEFDQGAEVRLRALSEIIYAGRIGSLPSLVAGEQYASSKLGNKPADIIVATPGVNTSARLGASGLGITGLEVALAIGITLVVYGCIAGAVVYAVYAYTNMKTRQQMLDICKDSIKQGDPKADLICKNMTTVVAKMAEDTAPTKSLIPPETQKTLLYLVAGGVGLFMAITFAPEIIRSLRGAKKAMQEPEEQIANLARLRRNAARWDKRFAGGW